MNQSKPIVSAKTSLHAFEKELKDPVFDFIGYKMNSSARDGTKASVLTYHRIIEAFKFGFARRSRLGDPEFNKDKNINKVREKIIISNHPRKTLVSTRQPHI